LFLIYILLMVILGAAINERKALQDPAATAAILAGLAIAAVFAILRNNWLAAPSRAELRFEEEPPDKLTSLNLSWDGGVVQHSAQAPEPPG
jgi:hypothetical protein